PLMLIMFVALIAFILGVVAFIRIERRHGQLAGFSFAVGGMAISSFFLFNLFIINWITIDKGILRKRICTENLTELGKVMLMYSNDYQKYPPPDKWCDVLVGYSDGMVKGRYLFTCPGMSDRYLRTPEYHYAINPKAEPNSPPDTVLLFEATPDRNQFGGQEIVELENHRIIDIEGILFSRPVKGCNILFNDGHVEFVKSEDISKLNWGDEQKQ
ncbi:hypothetical protein ACFL1G_10825, partial [Planctomycetota bacterium]